MFIDPAIRVATQSAAQQLSHWLIDSAYPLWFANGCDWQRGGFHERLDRQGNPLREPRRARVQPRQIYSLAMASSLGWKMDVAVALRNGLDFYLAAYRRADGLYRALVDSEGKVLDERAVLYDQAFALLALATVKEHATEASVAKVLAAEGRDLEAMAIELRHAIERSFAHERGFKTAAEQEHPLNASLQSNPHMHLLEACLAWRRIGEDPEWQNLANRIASLALEKFVDRDTGALREFFDAQWQPMNDSTGRVVEPGHQFEWAWLLMCWDEDNRHNSRRVAQRLMQIGEQHGVRNGLAVNTLLDDFSIHDGAARLWPQTERLKATALAARLSGDARYWQMTLDAANGLLLYLQTPLAGLWYDRRTASGEFIDEPAPASSFYHIVAAIAELQRLVS